MWVFHILLPGRASGSFQIRRSSLESFGNVWLACVPELLIAVLSALHLEGLVGRGDEGVEANR